MKDERDKLENGARLHPILLARWDHPLEKGETELSILHKNRVRPSNIII